MNYEIIVGLLVTNVVTLTVLARSERKARSLVRTLSDIKEIHRQTRKYWEEVAAAAGIDYPAAEDEE